MSKSFTAVILCGPGHALWPLNAGTNGLCKALLPVTNRPLIDGVLRWVEEAALTDALILAPAAQQTALGHYLRSRRQREPKSPLKVDLETFDPDEVDGTARVVAWAATHGVLRGDFVILPCDLAIRPAASTTQNRLAHMLSRHRAHDDLVSALVVERVAAETKDDRQARVMTIFDPKGHTLLDMRVLDDSGEDVPVRNSLLRAYPSTRVATNLVPTHVYVCSARVLDILAGIPRFESFKLDVIPFLAKAQWQTGLLASYLDGPPLSELRQPQALAISHSSTVAPPVVRSEASPSPSIDVAKQSRPAMRSTLSSVYSSLLTSAYSSNDVRASDASPRPPLDPAHWPLSDKVALSIWRPHDGICARVTDVASLAELNRMALKASPEPEGIMGNHVSVGERCSVKRCAIGDNCSLGKMAKLSGCVLMDNVAVGEGAKLDGCFIGSNARIGDNAQLSNCQVGHGVFVATGAHLKGKTVAPE